MSAEPRSEYYESQRVKLHYVVWGEPGARPPLLLIHGGQDHSRNWDFVAERLIGRYTIYAPDLRGHGDSAWAIGGMYSIPEFTLDVATLVDKIEGPLTVIGHSLGGAIALQYAGTVPGRVHKLVSVEGWGPPLQEHRPAHRRMQDWITGRRDIERRQPRRTHQSKTPRSACLRPTPTSRPAWLVT